MNNYYLFYHFHSLTVFTSDFLSTHFSELVEEDEKAEQYYLDALGIYQSLQAKFLEAEVRWNLGILYEEHQKWEKALVFFSASLTIYETFQQTEKMIETLVKMGDVTLGLGLRQDALALYQKALGYCKRIEDGVLLEIVKERIGGGLY